MVTRKNTKCAAGMRYRKTYTRKGRRITGRCIRSQTRAPESTRNRLKRVRQRMTIRMRGVPMSRRTIRGCPPGYITRKAYVRVTKRGKRSVVPATCIRDVGAPGKGLRGGPGIGPLREGELAKYGYTGIRDMEVSARRAALHRAVQAYGSLTVWRKLNALSVYTRRTSPVTSRVTKADMDWIRGTFGIKAF